MKPIVFYTVRPPIRGRPWIVSYRIFFEDRYVIWTPEANHVSCVNFDPDNQAVDRAFALVTFRNDPDTWTEVE